MPAADAEEAGVFSQPDRPVAYLSGQPLTQHALFAVLAEMDGGLALSEVLLDRALADRLRSEGEAISEQDLQAERQIILDSLAPDEDQAARLLREMRRRRGLGAGRFNALLRRNASLRKLVDDEIEVGEPAVRQAYEQAYGARYTVRLILTDHAAQAHQARRLALEGRSFIELAVAHSVDPSAARGGLLPPFSAADATYPLALREQVRQLSTESEAGRISPVITLGSGYAVVRLEAVTPAQDPGIDTVRDELEAQVRRRLERLRMQQLARTLVEGVSVIVLDPSLKQSWESQREQIEAAAGP